LIGIKLIPYDHKDHDEIHKEFSKYASMDTKIETATFRPNNKGYEYKTKSGTKNSMKKCTKE
jgi:hypothetical protein